MIVGKNMSKILTRRFGGKGNMANRIKQYFPPEDSFNLYCEPFAGSFGIGMTMGAPILIYNDLDKNIYSLYKVVSDESLFYQFKAKCDLAYYIEELRSEYKEELKRNDLSLVDRAFYFFYVSWLSHNSVGGFSLNTCVRRNMSKSVSDYLSAIDRLSELHQKLSKVIVTNKDGISLIERYNTPNCFLYLDPPYETSTRGSARYEVDMDRETHLRLLDAVQNSDAKILLSGYDCDIYNQLEQSGWRKEQFEVNTVDGKRRSKTKVETLWFNYKINEN